jgi:hypothetical protein
VADQIMGAFVGLSLGMIGVPWHITPSDDHLAVEVMGNVCGGAVEELAGQNKRVTACTAKFSAIRGLSAVVAGARLPASTSIIRWRADTSSDRLQASVRCAQCYERGVDHLQHPPVRSSDIALACHAWSEVRIDMIDASIAALQGTMYRKINRFQMRLQQTQSAAESRDRTRFDVNEPILGAAKRKLQRRRPIWYWPRWP